MRILAAIILAGLVGVTAGCGGGKKSPSTSTQASHPSSSAQPSNGSSETPKFASAKNCQDLAGLAQKVASAVTATSGNATATLKTESQQLQALANAAPSDIRGDFQTFATTFSSFLQALEKAGYKPGSTAPPTAKQISALTKAARSFNSAKLRQAETHLSAWVRQNCKGVHAGG
jgi:hypothetical protein